MEVPVFLLADYANVEERGKLNVMGIFNVIHSQEFPAVHPSMYVVAKLIIGLGEREGERELALKFLDADANELAGMTKKMKVPRGVGEPMPEINAIFHIRALKIPSPGRYQFSLYIDNDLKGTAPILVNALDGEKA